MIKKIFPIPLISLLLLGMLASACLDSGRGSYGTIKNLSSTNTDDDTDNTDDNTDNTTLTRPAGITISNYCACQDGKAIVINGCEARCADETSSNSPMLYVSTTLGADIKENPLLKNLYNWCHLAYGTSTAPNCVLRVYNDSTFTSKNLSIDSINAQDNSFIVNLTGQLTVGKRYLAELVDLESGVASSRFNLKLETVESSDLTVRDLAIEHISMYTCVSRAATIIDSQASLTAALKLSYFFAPSDRPDPIPSSDKYTLCHDPYISGQGTTDKSTYKRLFERPGTFALWGRKDGLFAASDSDDTVSEVNVVIKKLAEEAGITLSSTDYTIFGPLQWPIRPAVSTSSSSSAESSSSISSTSNMTSGDSVAPIIGYYMQPWVDKATNKPYCPGQDEFNTDTFFGILSRFIGETEAIYMARREDRTIVVNGKEQTAPADIILIREGILNKIWFYHDYDTGKDIPGDYTSARSQTMLFYWPPQYGDPLQKNSNSVQYTVRFPTDIGDSTDDSLGLPVKTPSDKRFGCIPKMQDEVVSTP